MTQPLKILFVEDLPTDQELAERQLRRAGGIILDATRVDTQAAFLRALEEFKPDLIISDYAMPEFDGMLALKLVQQLRLDIPFIVLTGSMNEETAVACMKAGAADYVIKEHMQRLPFAVQEALKRQQDRRQKDLADQRLRESEAKFRALFNNNRAVILLIDLASGAIADANPAACAYYGWDAADLTSKRISEINTLSDAEVEREMHKAATEASGHFEFKHRLASGEIRDVEVFSGPIDHAGKRLLYSIVHDTTERKRAEAALEQRRRLQERIAALGRDLSLTLDLAAIYQTAARHLAVMIDAPNFGITLFDPERSLLAPAYRVTDGVPVDPAALPPLLFDPQRASRGPLKAIAMKTPVLSCDLAGSEGGPHAAIYVPMVVENQVIGLLELQSYRAAAYSEEDGRWLSVVANQIGLAVQNARLFQDLARSNQDLAQAYDATIAGWSRAMDLRDHNTEGHSERVTEMTLELGRALGLDEVRLMHMRRGARLHDIGKLGVPDRILRKPGPLTDEEWVIMRQHTALAHEMLKSIDYLRPALAIPLSHHERWDGRGYPQGLKGEGIPLEARIFALVDVYDALTSDRPYRAAWTAQAALAYIAEQSGAQFDPNLAAVFLQLIQKP